jgi:hypothetical protein
VTPLLRRGAATSATAVMYGLLLWFVLEANGTHRGLAERSAALAEALWPLLVVMSSRYSGAVRNLKMAPAGSATVASRP